MKLERYILRQLILAFVLAVGGMFFVALPGIAVAAVHKLSGVGLVVVLRFLPLLAAGLFPYVIPIGFLLSVVVTFGRLAADQEWTAILMTGLHPLRMILPGLVFGLLLATGTFAMLSHVIPYLKFKTRDYQISAVSDVVKNLSPGRTEIRLGEFYLASAFRDGDEFLDALIHFPGEEHKIIAKRVRFSFSNNEMIVQLKDYQVVAPGIKARAEEGIFAENLQDLVEGKERTYTNPRYKQSPTLYRLMNDPSLPASTRRDLAYEFHERFALASTIGMFLLLGMATGLLLRRGTQLGALAVAVGYALIYYILSMRVGHELTRAGTLAPWAGAWSTVIAGSLVGVFLLRKALQH